MEITQDNVIELAESIGIDVDSHRCNCEVCMRTTALCPATFSSLALAIMYADDNCVKETA